MDVINDDSNEKMLTLHQNIVNLVNQLSMPLVEVSLVISKFTITLSEKLKQIALEHDEVLPKKYIEEWPLEIDESEAQTDVSIELEKVVNIGLTIIIPTAISEYAITPRISP